MNKKILTVLFIICTLTGLIFYSSRQKATNLGKQNIHYEIANTRQSHEKGLSGRDSLPDKSGMLFIFSSSEKYCFWMKDMRFPIDIVWLNEDKQIVFIEHNVLPGSYPKKFCPDQGARYVIEVNAGKVARADLKIGDRLQF